MESIIDETRKYMNGTGFVEDSEDVDGDYSIHDTQTGKRKYIRLVFRQKGNQKHIDYFLSKGWIKGKSYRNETGSPSMWDAEMFTRGCTTGVFMVSLEYPI